MSVSACAETIPHVKQFIPVFLYHAIAAGMTMGIVNAGMIGVYYQQFDRMIVEVQNIFELEGEF